MYLRGLVQVSGLTQWDLLMDPQTCIQRFQTQFPEARWIQVGKRTLIPLDPINARELVPVTQDLSKRSRFLSALSTRFPEVVFFLPQTDAHWKKLRKPVNDVLATKSARERYSVLFTPVIIDWVVKHEGKTITLADIKKLMLRLVSILISGDLGADENFYEGLFADFESLVSIVGLSAFLPEVVGKVVWSVGNGDARLQSINQRMKMLISHARDSGFSAGPFLHGLINRSELTEDEMIGSLLALEIAASDTTPITLAWVIDQLAMEGTFEADIRQSITSPVSFETISNLPLMERLINKVMIERSILATLNRYSEVQISLLGHEIVDAGYDIIIPMEILHRSSQKNYALGGGQTMCPGGSIAFDIISLVIANVLARGSRFISVKPAVAIYDKGLIRPEGGRWMIVQ